MKLFFKSILLTIFALASISFAANADPPGSEHGNMGASSMMEGHGYGSMSYGSMGYGHGMGHEGYGQKDWMMTPHNGAIHFLQMKDLLGLNEKQIADLKALRDSYRDENTIPEAKLKAAEESLKEIMEEDSINLEKAEGKIKEIGSLESGLWSSYVKQLTKIKTLITKEQLKKMWEMKRGGDGGHPGMR
ncbi:MAG TPA: hypothetical protein VN944_04380 [Nitrospiria bacterium]|nr:hypothetical protein [Nitrospiria bacterium]